MMADPLPIPMRDNPVSDTGRFSRTWAQYIDKLNTAVANVGKGVVDGSDATAGQVGEYLTASGSGVGLGGGTPANVATLSLTAGDWDVSGNVAFATTGATTAVVAGVSTVSGAFGSVYTHNSGTLGTSVQHRLGTGGSVRVNVTAAATVYLVAAASFSGGGVTASGEVWARRVR